MITLAAMQKKSDKEVEKVLNNRLKEYFAEPESQVKGYIKADVSVLLERLSLSFYSEKGIEVYTIPASNDVLIKKV